MRSAVAAVVLAVTGLACAGDGGTSDVRTIEIAMVDIAYDPAVPISVAAGETIRFVFTNDGTVPHDGFVGDESEQAEHEAQMRADADAGHGGGHGDDATAITVEPGDTGELSYTFEEPAALVLGCHQPGHYAAGMRIPIEVT